MVDLLEVDMEIQRLKTDQAEVEPDSASDHGRTVIRK